MRVVVTSRRRSGAQGARNKTSYLLLSQYWQGFCCILIVFNRHKNSSPATVQASNPNAHLTLKPCSNRGENMA
jgi:hypothetical protein